MSCSDSRIYDRYYWYHGTHAAPFPHWKFSTNTETQHQHSAAFFSRNRSVAREYGPRLCRVQIRRDAHVLTANTGTTALEALRHRIIRHPLGKQAFFAEDSGLWQTVWSSHLALSFYLNKHPDANQHLHDESPESLSFRRAWIELICREARALGYDGILTSLLKTLRGNREIKPYRTFIALREDVMTPPLWLK